MRLLSTVALSLVAVTVALPACSRPTSPEPMSNAQARPYPHEHERIGSPRQIYDGALAPQLAVNTFRNAHRLFPTRTIPRSGAPFPLRRANTRLESLVIRDGGNIYGLEDYLKLNRIAGLLVLQGDQIKLERYRFGNSDRTRWLSMSIAKSVTSTLIGAAVKQGLIGSLADPVVRYVPSLAGSAYEGVTVRDVLTMSSGVRWDETYRNPRSDRRHLLEAQISQKPGSALALLRDLPRVTTPGQVFNYSTGEAQVAAEILHGAVKTSLATYLWERIWNRFGMEDDATWWLESPAGIEVGGSGMSATLRDYGRFGLFLLSGTAKGDTILSYDWLRDATSAHTLRNGTEMTYGYFWWTPPSLAAQPPGGYAAKGLYGQGLYINPSLQVVIVVWSARTKAAHEVVDDWAFFSAVVEALNQEAALPNQSNQTPSHTPSHTPSK
ncbi:MAG: serine hydrolase domain-containing protein [Longimicrobiales bacterium]